MTDRRIGLAGLVAFFALALVLSGCGIPVGGGPSAINPNSVPADLRIASTFAKPQKCPSRAQGAPKGSRKSAAFENIDVWFFNPTLAVAAPHLTPAPRCIPAPPKGTPAARTLAEVKSALDQLLKGPTISEHRHAIWSPLSSIPPGPTKPIESVNYQSCGGVKGCVPNSVVVLVVSGSWDVITDASDATGQVVWTVTGINPKLGVLFKVDEGQGQVTPLSNYDPAGNLINGPATRSDYASLSSSSG